MSSPLKWVKIPWDSWRGHIMGGGPVGYMGHEKTSHCWEARNGNEQSAPMAQEKATEPVFDAKVENKTGVAK